MKKQSKSSNNPITVISPNKYTFLQSNQLIKTVLNKNLSLKKFINKSIAIPNYQTTEDAYKNCQLQRIKLQEENISKSKKLKKVRSMVLENCEKYQAQKQNQLDQIKRQYIEIQVLKSEMVEKAHQIMSKKESKYQRAQIIDIKTLKSIQQKNLNLIKMQNIREYMKQQVRRLKSLEFRKQQVNELNNSFISSSFGNNSISFNSTSFQQINSQKSIGPTMTYEQLKTILHWPKTEQQFRSEIRRNVSRVCFIKEEYNMDKTIKKKSKANLRKKDPQLPIYTTYAPKASSKLKQLKKHGAKKKQEDTSIIGKIRAPLNMSNRYQEIKSVKYFVKQLNQLVNWQVIAPIQKIK